MESRSGDGAFSPAKVLAATRTISEAHGERREEVQVRSSESGAECP